ncbi:7272_t:CDS:10, partial [Funneliformis geosporum]
HSLAPNPLSYLEFIGNPSIEILPRNIPDHSESSSIVRRYIEDDGPLRYDDSMRIQFIAFNRTFSIHLEPNLDLFHPEATITIHHSNNSKTTTRLRHEDHRLYKGVVLDIDSTDIRLNEDIVGFKRRSLSEELSYSSGVLGWARIQVHDDGGNNKRHPTFEGTFILHNELYHIKSIENYQLTKFKDDPEIPNPSARHDAHKLSTMVIYRESDVKKVLYNKRSSSDVESCSMEDVVGADSLRRNRIAHGDFLSFNSNEQFGSSWWNLKMGSVFEDKHKLSKRDVTGCPTGRKIAYMASAADCTYVGNYKSPDAARKQILQNWGTASAVYEKTFNVTLGLIKIEILPQQCPQTTDPAFPFNRQCEDKYTINDRLSDFSQWRGKTPGDGAGLWHLMSKCNTGTKVGVAWLGQLCKTESTLQDQGQYVSGTGISTVVKDEWKVVAHELSPSQSMCGNGLKEDNEQCDCGTDCDSDPCCDGTTCKFKGNAVCDDINDMCCNKCQFKPANEMCRPASSNCDIPEYCNGTSGVCPFDKHIDDGTACAPNLACAGGQCTSRDNQCLTRGSRLGIKKACSLLSDSYPTCTMSCANPNDTRSCIEMSGFFVDGTPCGFGGRCNKGQCGSGTIGNSFSSWLNSNKRIIIPIAAVVGLILLCCILQCVFRCCRKRRNNATKIRIPSLPPKSRTNSYNTHNGYNKWVDESQYNGPSYANHQEYNNEPVPMPTPVHRQNSHSPDFMYAGTGHINTPPTLQTTFQSRVSPSPRSPHSMRSMGSSGSPRSPNPNSPRNFVEDTFYNGPRIPNYQINE